MTIYFRPTYLYIKKHNITGLKYFGKTTRSDPTRYKGSGVYWSDHLKVHGNDVTTLWYQLYDSRELLCEEAMAFSTSHDIVNSPEWANLIPEDGVGGWQPGHQHSEESKQKMILAQKNRTSPRKRSPMSEETKEKIRIAIQNKGPRSEETKQKLSTKNRGKTHTLEARKKISEAGKGRKCPKTEEHRHKLSLANKGKTIPEETKRKISLSLNGRPKR